MAAPRLLLFPFNLALLLNWPVQHTLASDIIRCIEVVIMPEPGWVAKARSIAKKYGVPIPLMLATVEGETDGRNMTGDIKNGVPQSFGYGQIQPKWEAEQIHEAAKECRKPDPGEDPAALGQFLLDNPECSMIATALVVKLRWQEASGDYDVFLKKYVGPSQAAGDRARRWAIYQRWLDQENQ